MSLRAAGLRLALAAVVSSIAGCTETPYDLPECVGPGSYCPSLDGGSETGDASSDTARGVQDASAASDAASDG